MKHKTRRRINRIYASRNRSLEKRLTQIEYHTGLIAGPEFRKQGPNRHFGHALAEFAEHGWITRLVVVFGIFAAIVALFIYYDEWEARKEERIARAWQTLSFDSGGNTGQGDAIEYLHKSGAKLIGIDLGSKTKSKAKFVSDLKLKDATLYLPALRYARLSGLDLENSEISAFDGYNSAFDGNFRNVDIVWGDLRFSIFNIGNLDGSVTFRESVLDYSTITLPPELVSESIENYYVSDDEGTLSDDDKKKIASEEIKQKLVAAREFTDVLKFENSSLRCAHISLRTLSIAKFENTNISGAYFQEGYDVEFGKLPKFSLQEDDLYNLFDTYYFSDNPPFNIPNEVLEQYSNKLERAEVQRLCQRNEPRSFLEEPFAELDGVDGIDAICVSLAKSPDKCERNYSYDGRAALEELRIKGNGAGY